MAEDPHDAGPAVDVEEHERVFENFVRMATWVAGFVVVVLVFLALINA